MTTEPPAPRGRHGKALWWAGLAVALVCAGVFSVYASGSPDGLEWVSELLGFSVAADEHASAGSPLADYQVDGVTDPRVSGSLAGLAGTLIVLAVTTGVIWVLRRRSARKA